MARYVVGTVDDIPPGERKIVEIGGRAVGVFNVGGEYFAILNRCPHQGGSLCSGRQTSLVTSSRPGEYSVTRPGEIIRCPWHGWEFDLRTGQSWFDPRAVRVRRYDVSVEPGAVVVNDADLASGPAPSAPGTAPEDVAAAGGGEPDPTMGGLAKGPYVAETYPVVIEQQYVIVDTGRRG
ncbi:MAG: Rieske (2Fe-2S) protein [Chloroflexota bacterium]|nr:Rieske (2Fe-2S) protein [Chloroflexota bacterium]